MTGSSQIPARCFVRPALALALGAAVAIAEPIQIELPAETGSFKPGPGVEFANGQCLVCHSVEYVQMQPPLPRSFWAASVKKMQDKFGAQIPPEQVGALIDYLARNYGTETNLAPAHVSTTTHPTAMAAPAVAGETVAGKYGCLACHNAEVKIVGPPYKAIAAKYANDPQAAAKIAEQIHKGGSGKWGPVIMPPFPMVSGAEIKALADWILSRK